MIGACPRTHKPALQAAAVVYAAGNYSNAARLTQTAAEFKAWLDAQDQSGQVIVPGAPDPRTMPPGAPPAVPKP